MGEGGGESLETSKKGRHRKKQFYSSILHQMEFYFSDSNLTKDRFLSQLLKQDPYIDLEVFLSFNKIRKLNCTADDIRKAITKSELIELSEDKQKIKRTLPIKIKENTDECTIYVENLKPDANHDVLIQIFSEFGNVVYVSIPKCKNTKTNKGFAFIEYENEKEAEAALDFFESIDCKMPSDTNPEELTSIKTFEGNECKSDLKDEANEQKKRKISEEEEEKPMKKIKFDQEDEESGSKGDEEDKNDLDEGENKKKKKQKKDKKKNYIKELKLSVLSKKEWKKLRNKYLNLQHKKMKEFKQHLRKLNQNNTDDNKTKNNKKEDSLTDMQFTPNVIVKLKLTEYYDNVKKLKADIKSSNPNVQYVDISHFQQQEAYVRFSTSEAAKEFCNQNFPGEKSIVQGEEEKLYWEKIQKDRLEKCTKNSKKIRGRDKLLKKAEHLRFDDGD